MIDSALIRQCSDKAMEPAMVEMFIERAGANDPLAITVRAGNRVILVPKAAAVEEAMDLIRKHVGRNMVRVGITQYPAGLGVVEAGELKPDLVDACANLRMGTALFAKVYRIVIKWYGNPTDKAVLPQVFDDAIIAWQTGYFEGTAVFRASDPAADDAVIPEVGGDAGGGARKDLAVNNAIGEKTEAGDPAKAGIRIDLSGIRGASP